MDKAQLPHQANIMANDFSRDYRRISQPLIVGLWLKAYDYGQGLGQRVSEFWQFTHIHF